MNAGAYGGEMKQVIEQVTVITAEWSNLYYHGKKWSCLTGTAVEQKNHIVVLEAEMSPETGNPEKIQASDG